VTDLPPGWARTTLGEIAQTSLGKMLDRGNQSGFPLVPYLRNVNVQWGQVRLDDVLTMEMAPSVSDHFALRAGDLLVCEGGEIGRCAVWPGTTEYVSFQKAVHRVRPLADIDPRLLRYGLEHLSQRGVLAKHATGSTIKHLPQQKLRQLPMPLPPVAEQRRIVEVLEAHLSRLDAAAGSVEHGLARLHRLWEAVVIAETMGPRPSTGKAWPMVAVSEVAEVQGGIQKQPNRFPTHNRYPFLRVANVTRYGLRLDEVHEVELFDGELERYRLVPNDLLIVEGNGSPSQVGRAAMWRGELNDCVHQNHLIRVRPNSEVNPRFLELAWNAPETRRRLSDLASSTSGLHTLSTRKIKALRVPMPSLDQQDGAVAAVDRWRSGIQATGVSLETSSRRAKALRQTLLAAAFSGRLVPQDPNDEPAALLLKRIQAEQATEAPPARRTRRAEAAQ